MFLPQSASIGLCIQYSSATYRTSVNGGGSAVGAENGHVYDQPLQQNTDLLSSPAVWHLCQLLCQYPPALIRVLLKPFREISGNLLIKAHTIYGYTTFSVIFCFNFMTWSWGVWIITRAARLIQKKLWCSVVQFAKAETEVHKYMCCVEWSAVLWAREQLMIRQCLSAPRFSIKIFWFSIKSLMV